MKINDINHINSTESIDNIITSIVNGLINFEDTDELKLEIMFKIRKMKLQIYFDNEFNKYYNLINSKKTFNNKKENIKIDSKKINKGIVKSKANKKVKEKMIIAKGKLENPPKKDTISKQLIDYDSIKNKSINEIAIELNQPQKRLLLLLSKKNNKYLNANEDTLINEEIWEYLQDYLKNAYKLKISREKLEKSISTNPNKKAQKFKASSGRPGNYAKLILIRTKT
jgi:hypothetical protein